MARKRSSVGRSGARALPRRGGSKLGERRISRRQRLYRLVTVGLVLAGAGLAWLAWQVRTAPHPRGMAPVPISVEPAPTVPPGVPPVAAIPYANAPVGEAFDPNPATAPSGVQPGANLYALPGQWLDASGREFPLSSLQGRPAVFTFAYSGCRALCPIVLDTLDRALQRLPAADRSRARLLLIAIDPARDTPAAMAAYGEALGLEARGWRMIAGPPEAIARLAEQVEFRFTPNGAGFAHNAVAGVADASGAITARFTEGFTRPGWLARGIARGLGR